MHNRCCLHKESQRACLGGITVGRPPSVPFLFTFHIQNVYACWILCIRFHGNTTEIHVPLCVDTISPLFAEVTEYRYITTSMKYTNLSRFYLLYLFSHWFTLIYFGNLVTETVSQFTLKIAFKLI